MSKHPSKGLDPTAEPAAPSVPAGPGIVSPHAGHRERIRARYAEFGGDAFLDHQFLELLLTYAVPRRDTNELAHALLARFGSLEQIFCASAAQLQAVDGVGGGVAVFLCMQGDLMRRLSLAKLADARGRIKLGTPLVAAQYALARLHAQPYETVLMACLNSRCEVVRTEMLQRGTLTEAPVYPRVIAERALLNHAHSVLLMHNHPSGNPTPSGEDAASTEAVRAALAGIGIRLNDHLIVGGAFVYSFSADVLVDLSGRQPQTLPLGDFCATAAAGQGALLKVMEHYPQK